MFTNIWFSRKVFGLFLLSLAVSFIRKKLGMLSCKVATIGWTRKLIGLLLLSLMVSFVGWHVEARRWSFAKPISYAASAPKAGASSASPVREAIARKLQTQAKVKVELFVMSQCPFGVQAEEAMAPVLKEFGERVDFQLRFIAKPTGDGFTSMHGQPEVDEDLRQTVMAAQFPQQYFDYVVARASDYRNTEWQPAAIAAGMEVAAVEGFARSEAGRRLFAENIRRANELRITASPTILLDGEKYTGKILPAIAAATAYGKTSAAVAPSAVNGTEAMPCTQASDCNDNNACTIDACDPTFGCVNTQLICDDSNACTRDTCDPAQGCVYTPISCNDGNPNTADSCNSTKGCINTPCPTITVTNPATTTVALGVAFSQQFTQSGGSVNTTFSTSSTLPNGLMLASNGTLSGTPTQSGMFPLTVTATDNNSCTSTGTTYNLNITCVTNPVVTTTADSGAGSLRDVIAQACPDSTITFANGLGTITLTSGELLIGKNLTIQGPGANLLTVNNTAAASPTSRLFKINGGATVTLSGLTLSGGNVLIDDNSLANVGGSAIYNTGNLTIRNCVITSNQHAFTGIRVGVSEAGAVYNQGILNVISSLIFGNTANRGQGGGIFNAATANLINSTISGNSSRSSQINTPGAGAGISNRSVLNLINCTVAFNTADIYGGIYTTNGKTTIKNTIIASNTGSNNTSLGSDYYGPIGSLGNNVIGNTNGIGDSLGTFPASGDWQNQDPLLMPLNNNGGPTATHALSPDSPALNAGSTPAEIQFVYILGISGSFTLTFDGQATSPLPVGASAATVQAALNNLASIGGVGGAVTVTGTRAGNNGSRIFTIEFGGSLASTNQPQITAAATGGATVNGIGTALEGDAFPTTDQRGPGFPRQVGSAIDIGAFEVQNNAPTLTLNTTAPSLSQGSQQTGVALGSVNDVESPVGGLQVSITSTNPSNGVTLSQFTNNSGLLSATIQADCNATNASFTLAVSDGAGGVTTAQLHVTVTANTAPVLSYPSNPGTTFGTGLTVNPLAPPTDNGSIQSFQVASLTPALASGISVNSAGVVTVASSVPANTYTVKILATDNCGLSTEASFTLGIVKATPTITWNNPADITYGTALGATQLNAATSVAGSFSYSPAAGTVLNAGSGQTLTANFMPTDTANYNSASRQVQINVLKAPLSLVVHNAWRNQGAANPPLSGLFTGLKNNDAITASYSTTATPSSTAGTYAITATLVDANNRLPNYTVTNTPGTLTVLASCSAAISPTSLPSGMRGQAYNAPLSVVALLSSVAGPYTFTHVAGQLPPGINLVNNNGAYALSGVPTTAGTYTFTLLATRNAGGCSRAVTYTVTIAP